MLGTPRPHTAVRTDTSCVLGGAVPPPVSRRGLLGLTAGTVYLAASSSQAALAGAEVPLPPQSGTCPTCIGLVDGTLGRRGCGSCPSLSLHPPTPLAHTRHSCAGIDACSSSYDDRPPHFVAPWQYEGQPGPAQQQLQATLEQLGGSIRQQQPGYIWATFSALNGTLYDAEFAFADNDAVVAVRAAARGGSPPWWQGGPQSADILEQVRLALSWEPVPILRNRRRALLFVESPWDDFGPVPPQGGVDYGDLDSGLQ